MSESQLPCHASLLYLLLLTPRLGADALLSQDGKGADSLLELARASTPFRLRLKTHSKAAATPLEELYLKPGVQQERSHQQQQRHKAITKGIVISAGGRNMLGNALVTALVLRGPLGCLLPIEISYHGDDEADRTIIAMLEKISEVRVKDIAKQPYPTHVYRPEKIGGWLKKVLCVYHATYDQILYLDADSLPLINPEEMFEWEGFQTHGTTFWPDYMGAGTDQSIKEEAYTAFGLRAPWADNPSWRCTESGQLLLDRHRHAAALDWLVFLNAHGNVRDDLMYGNKDTFELAFALAGSHSDFHQLRIWPRSALSEQKHDDTYWQVGLIQNTPTGQPAFWHRTSQPEKWVLDRDPSSMVRPRFVTPPLGLQATGTMQWNHEWQNVCFGEGRVVTDDQLECKNVDLASMLLIEQQDPDRWRECHSGYGDKEEVPVALIPIEWFGPSELITFAFKTTWEAVQASLKVIAATESQQQEARNR